MDVDISVLPWERALQIIESLLPNFNRPASINTMCKDFEIDKTKIYTDDFHDEVTKAVVNTYNKCLPMMNNYVVEYRREWNNIKDCVLAEFTKLFGKLNLENLNIYLWPCNVAPYFKDGFCVSANSLDIPNFRKTVVHELTHLHWWQFWAEWGPVPRQPAPSMVWHLSEMVIQTIVDNSELKNIVNKPVALKEYYTMEIDGENVLTHLDKLFKQSDSMQDFTKASYYYVSNNEEHILCQTSCDKTK